MTTAVQLRGGTTTQHSSFTGLNREVTVDTDKKTLVVHDGATAGGNPLATESALADAVASARVHYIGEVFVWTGPSNKIPTGAIALPTSPTNASRTTYAAYFAIVGTMYGAGDGSTTFGLPYAVAGGTTVHDPANVGQQTNGQMPQHNHTATQGVHSHSASAGFTNATPLAQNVGSNQANANDATSAGGLATGISVSVDNASAGAISIGNAGSGTINAAAGLKTILCLQVL